MILFLMVRCRDLAEWLKNQGKKHKLSLAGEIGDARLWGQRALHKPNKMEMDLAYQ